ncbi:hypothetical protein PENCOP_c005G01405 [Penicillium coprophilum]|uniref:Uncharacterized protein n=1 Tax=Penicillium coprophilum TaxID=36646 RepID=A0A1V6URR2_9EURO|nr:hypothetical protein PENCOP_c005G01405 [Penicillium coprophilum]
MMHTDNEWAALCEKVKGLVPEEIGEQAWTLVTAATLAASPSTNLMGNFYSYLTRHDPQFSPEDAQHRLSIRFRDILLKLITLVGAPRVLCVLMPLAEAEGNVKAKSAKSSLDKKWKPETMDVQRIYDRGTKTINAIYGSSLLPKIFDTWGAHKEDVKFNEVFAIYGLYLSDFDILTALETEAVVYATISCLGLGGPGNWHLRGMGRMLGAKGPDSDTDQAKHIKVQLNNLREAIMDVVRFAGDDFVHRARLDKWATVESMLSEFESWGDDE